MSSNDGGKEVVLEEAIARLDVDAPYAGPLAFVDNLAVDFPTLDGVVHAVRGVSWELNSGEVLGIVGESGSGKSVSAMALLGLLPSSAHITGSATYKGVELLGRPAKEMNRVRGKHIAMVFQDPMTSLNPVYKIGWQLSEAILAHNEMSKADAWERSIDLLNVVGIPDPKERVSNYPHEFSGGMRQRVVIAVAMANDPDIIIADEPTTALDVTVQAQVLEALRKAQEETGAALVLITHDLGVVAGMADRVNVMYAGRVVESGTVDDIYYEPRMPYTVGLLGSLPRLDTDAIEKLTPIQGAPPSLISLPSGCPFSPRCPMVKEDCIGNGEPELEVTETGGHTSACFYWRDLTGTELATEVFAATAVDDADALAVAIGTEFEAEIGKVDSAEIGTVDSAETDVVDSDDGAAPNEEESK